MGKEEGKAREEGCVREQLQNMPVRDVLLRVSIIFLCIDCKDKWIFFTADSLNLYREYGTNYMLLAELLS